MLGMRSAGGAKAGGLPCVPVEVGEIREVTALMPGWCQKGWLLERVGGRACGVRACD